MEVTKKTPISRPTSKICHLLVNLFHFHFTCDTECTNWPSKYRGNIVGIVIPFLETIVNENVTNESKQLLQKSLIRV